MYIDNAKSKYSQEETENGIKTTVTIYEVENGYIYQIEKYSVSDSPGVAVDSKRECKTYISKDNPLDKVKKKEEEDKPEDTFTGMKKLLNSI